MGRSARPALFCVAAATKEAASGAPRRRGPLPGRGPAPDPMSAQWLRRPSRCFGPSGARTSSPAVADPARGRDGRGLPNGGYYNEQEQGKVARRPVRPHHGPHHRRARTRCAPLGSTLDRREYSGPHHPTAATQRPALYGHQRLAALVRSHRARLLLADLDDVQAGQRTWRACP